MKKSWMIGVLGSLLAVLAILVLVCNCSNDQNNTPGVDSGCHSCCTAHHGENCPEDCTIEGDHHHGCSWNTDNCPEDCTIEGEHHHHGCGNWDNGNCPEDCTIEGEHYHHGCGNWNDDDCPEDCTIEGEHHHHGCSGGNNYGYGWNHGGCGSWNGHGGCGDGHHHCCCCCCCCHYCWHCGHTEKPVEPAPGPDGPDVPSVGQNGAPRLCEFVDINDETGTPCVAILRDEYRITYRTWSRDALSLIPMADRNEEYVPEDVKKELEAAYKSVTEAELLTDVAVPLELIMNATDSELKAEDLVVMDLFYVGIPADAKEMLHRLHKSTITTVFDVDGLEPGDTVYFLQYFPVSDLWHVIEPTEVCVMEGGYVRASFEHDIGTVAIVGERG